MESAPSSPEIDVDLPDTDDFGSADFLCMNKCHFVVYSDTYCANKFNIAAKSAVCSLCVLIFL